MRNYAIITDSSCDLPIEIIDRYDIKVVPMGITIDNKAYRHYHDYRELSKDDFYGKMRDGHVGSTSGVNIQDAIDVMREVLENNMDIVYLSISSALSCSYQNACLAADELLEDFPDANIKIIDTRSVSIGVGMLTYIAVKKKTNGATFHQVVEYIENNKLNICHHFIVDDLKYIQRSGRASHLSAMVGTMLNIKPAFKMDDNGKVKDDGKIRGRKAGMRHLIERTKEKCTDPSLFFVCHADTYDDVKILENQIKESYPRAEVVTNCIGPILGNNTGIGTLAVICYGENR